MRKILNHVNTLEPKKRQWVWSIVFIVAVLVVFGSIFGFVAFKNWMAARYMAHFRPPPATVSIATVQSKTWHPYLSSVGTLQAIQGGDISPQVSGIVTEIYFQSGEILEKSQPIIRLDVDVLQAELNRYKAAEKLAEIDFKRQGKLYKEHAIAQSTYDQALANLSGDTATVKQYEALLQQKTIVAPFSGKVGIRQVSLGQYLDAGDVITNLQMLNPIHLNYYVPEQNISQVHVGQAVEMTVESYPGQVFEGKVNAVDAQINQDAKSIEVQAVFQNTDDKHLLYPGMYAQVRTILPQEEHVITIPQEAINYTLYGDSVFVIEQKKEQKKDKQAKMQTLAKKVSITTGVALQNQVPVTKGLTAGQQVVVQGQIKLQDATPVKIVETAQ